MFILEPLVGVISMETILEVKNYREQAQRSGASQGSELSGHSVTKSSDLRR